MFNGGSTALKFFKRLGIYKNSTGTVEFNPKTKTGRSYNWNFLEVVDGLLVFNSYKWSPTTSNHQSAIASVLKDLGIKPDIKLDLGDIQPSSISKSKIESLYKEAFELEIEIELATKKDSYAQTHRHYRLSEIKSSIEILVSKMPRLKVSQKTIKELRAAAFESAMNDLMDKQSQKVYKILSLNAAKTDLAPIEL